MPWAWRSWQASSSWKCVRSGLARTTSSRSQTLQEVSKLCISGDCCRSFTIFGNCSPCDRHFAVLMAARRTSTCTGGSLASSWCTAGSSLAAFMAKATWVQKKARVPFASSRPPPIQMTQKTFTDTKSKEGHLLRVNSQALHSWFMESSVHPLITKLVLVWLRHSRVRTAVSSTHHQSSSTSNAQAGQKGCVISKSMQLNSRALVSTEQAVTKEEH